MTRWSRRKQAARGDEKVDQEPSPGMAEDVATPAPTPVLTDKDMPSIEGLTEESDFSGFLSPGVSAALRRQALRKLFHLPVFNTRCPLDSEYYDCHGYEPLGNIITHEMREALEREAEELKLAARAALSTNARQAPPTAMDSGSADDCMDAGGRATPAAVAGNAGAAFPPVVGAEQAANPGSPTTKER